MDNFDEATKNQIKVGKFLKAFDPILGPAENFAKFGISLAAGITNFTATVVTILSSQKLFLPKSTWILYSCWVILLASISFGLIQL